MLLTEGHTLNQRYVIIKALGTGGFATVYLAQDSRLADRYVAIKVLELENLPISERSQAIQHFQQEATVLGRFSHPGIAAVLDYFGEESTQYLVMEYVRGETLAEALQRIPGGRYHEKQVITWARQLCDVLDHLHCQHPAIIFRDLKPQNIMVERDGHLKLIDFGIARYFKPGQTRDTRAFGTPGYSAPEQYGQEQTDARSDIYSLGALLHQLLTGVDPANNPFFFLPIDQLAPDVSRQVARAVEKALSRQPKERFATIREFEQALLHGITQAQAGRPTLPPWSKWVFVAGLAVILITGVGFTLSRLQARSQTPPANNTPIVQIVTATPGPTVQTTATRPATRTPRPTATHVPVTTTVVTLTVALPVATPLPQVGNWVAFSSRVDGDFEIMKLNVETGELVQLTFNDTQDYRPVWSPDGNRIAFHALIDASTQYDIFVMDADGSHLYNLTAHPADEAFPSWSPDGTQIVFHSNRYADFEIFITDVSGANVTQLTYNDNDDNTPAWSPDGTLIAFNRNVFGTRQIFVMDWDGRNERQITSAGGDHVSPSWSPDSTRLVFSQDQNGSTDLYLVDLDGSNFVALTNTPENEYYPMWTADGAWIVYHLEEGGARDLYHVSPDDGAQRFVILAGVADERQPDWQPLRP